jgi:cytochrome P450
MGHAAPAGVPVFEAFDPMDPAHVADPYPWLHEARAKCPVFFMPKYNWYVVTRLADITKIANDTDTFSNSMFVVAPDVPEKYRDRLPHGFPMKVQLAAADPPDHGRLKRFAQPGLSPKAVAAHAADIRRIAGSLVDRMLEAPSRQANIVACYAERIPIMTIAAMLDAPVEDYDRYRQWVDASLELITTRPSAERLDALTETLIDFDIFVRELIASRREKPANDIISSLVRAADEGGDQLREEEVLGLVSSIMLGGADTTGTGIGNMVRCLLNHREQWDAVRRDRTLLSQAFEESVRFMDPGRGPLRLALKDTEVAGIPIPKGALIQLCTKAADRDEDVFERSEEFDIFRKDLKISPTWGRGIHMCIGRSLAHLEAEIALDTLLDRVPDLRLVGDGAPQYMPQLMMPTMRNLTVTWGD